MIKSNLGKQIKRLRLYAGMTQEEFSKKVGVSRRHFWGNGYNRLFSLFYSQKSKVLIQRNFNEIQRKMQNIYTKCKTKCKTRSANPHGF